MYVSNNKYQIMICQLKIGFFLQNYHQHNKTFIQYEQDRRYSNKNIIKYSFNIKNFAVHHQET